MSSVNPVLCLLPSVLRLPPPVFHRHKRRLDRGALLHALQPFDDDALVRLEAFCDDFKPFLGSA